jgi:adenylosuccinate synthase
MQQHSKPLSRPFPPFPALSRPLSPLQLQVRETGREYGTTTGRPRRVGWLDIVALNYVIK